MRFALLLLLVLLAGTVHAQSPDSTGALVVIITGFKTDEGAPREPFAFSNDARVRFGPPDFAEATFRFAAPRNAICFRVQ